MKRYSLIFLSLVCTVRSFSQNYQGYNTGNYTGVNAVFFNPANIADNPYKWDVNLVSLNATISNDYAKVDTKNLFKAFNSDSLDKYLIRKNGSTANLSLDADVFGPSFMFNLNSKSSLAITTRGRLMINGDKVPDNLLNTLENNGDNITFPSNLSSSRFGITGNMWTEYGVTYARVLSDDKLHYFKAGLTLKYLGGIGSGYFVSTNFNGTIDKDILGNSFLRAATGQLLFGYSGSIKFDDIAKFKTSGNGFGGDIGFVYESRPTDYAAGSLIKYKFKAELALHDIGSISYTHSADDGTYNLNTALNPRPFPFGSDTMQLKRFSDVSDFNSLRDAINGSDPMLKKVTNASSKYSMSLPASVTGAVDYNFNHNFYINLGGMISLNKGGTKAEKTHSLNYVTLTPRYEKKAYGFYLPLTYNDISGFNAGISMRGGPFFFGSGSILSTLLSGKTQQADFHFGIHIGIVKKDKKPKIVNVKEVKTTTTIIDTDKDGIPDNDDKCPTVAGIAKYNGCPIPDSDSDGVNDELDKCPTVPGLVKYDGCPAPDTDKDGISDDEDKCPTVPGVARYQGCPIPDTDKDGINDEEDKCPTVPGVARYNGCPVPDTDKDSVNDEEDKCPTIPGPPSNHGCPVIKKEIIQKVNFAAKNLLFQTGKAIILKKSYTQLDNVTRILKADSSLNIEIDGHTDNSGDSLKNMKLSADRANAAKAYFVKKGIAGGRISTQGYGPTKPIATNKTPQGRAKNRRVEFILKNY